jgi:hypothetical protein
VDEAYAALRDLNCEVQYVKVTSEGKIEPMYQQFGGEGTRLNFNPIWDDHTEDMEERVRQEARAPFARTRDALVEADEEEEHLLESCCGHGTGVSYDHAHDHTC